MDQPFVESSVATPAGPVPVVRTRWTVADTLGAWRVRWDIRRMDYRVDPGLYAVGSPRDSSPVLATANYKLTFDVVRRELAGIDAWILVLDTRGINVWCAAGKKRFSTDELAERVIASDLDRVVSHRRVIVPQLGATGVAAHLVRRRCGFSAVFGPVRACDIPAFLDADMKATPEMRRVAFPMWDRFVLTPVELVGIARYGLWAVPVLAVLAILSPAVFASHAPVPATVAGLELTRGLASGCVLLAGALAGAVVTPILLPWIPVRSFWLKGAIMGGVLGAGAGWALTSAGLTNAVGAAGLTAGAAAVAAWGAMNYTGTSTFTSPSGVEAEMRRGIPIQLALAVAGTVVWIASAWMG